MEDNRHLPDTHQSSSPLPLPQETGDQVADQTIIQRNLKHTMPGSEKNAITRTALLQIHLTACRLCEARLDTLSPLSSRKEPVT